MLGLRSHRETRFTHCVRCARTLAVSQITKRAGTRADLSPALLGGAIRPACAPPAALREQSFLGESVGPATGTRPAACRAPQARSRATAGLDARLSTFHSNKEQSVPRQAVGGCALARLCGGEREGRGSKPACAGLDGPSARCVSQRAHRVSVGARTRALRELARRICSSATSAASYAARPKAEHRSAVGAPLAPTAAVARQRTPARGLAHASTSTLRTFKDRNGPQAVTHSRPQARCTDLTSRSLAIVSRYPAAIARSRKSRDRLTQ